MSDQFWRMPDNCCRIRSIGWRNIVRIEPPPPVKRSLVVCRVYEGVPLSSACRANSPACTFRRKFILLHRDAYPARNGAPRFHRPRRHYLRQARFSLRHLYRVVSCNAQVLGYHYRKDMTYFRRANLYKALAASRRCSTRVRGRFWQRRRCSGCAHVATNREESHTLI